MTDGLEGVLANWQGRVAELKAMRATTVAPETLADCLAEISREAERYTKRLSEVDAHLYSGRSVRWLRSRYAELEARGDAGKHPNGERWYRMAALPRGANIEQAEADAVRTAREDFAA